MECPNPQPGQKSIPTSLKRHNVKWDADAVGIIASKVNPEIQNNNSKYRLYKFIRHWLSRGRIPY
jgi:hypothetical protein